MRLDVCRLQQLAVCLFLGGMMIVSPGRGQKPSADSVRLHPYQFGVSASSVFKLLEEGEPAHQYQLYGRYWRTPQRMVRAALRYHQVVGENTEVDVGLRGGMAWVVQREGAWRFYGGGDVLAGYRRFANGNASFRVGVSPLFGVLFFVSPHVSISLEPRLVAEYARSLEAGAARSGSDVFSIEIDGAGLLILSVHF